MLFRNGLIKSRSAGFFAEGNAKRDQKNWVAAARAYQSGLEINPDHFPAWVQLGHALKEAGDLEEAEKAYCKAFDLMPDDDDLLLHLTHLRSRLANPDLQQHRPATAERRVSGNNVPTKIGQTASAVARSGSVQHSATLAAELFRTADASRDRGDWSKAAATYEKGLALAPNTFSMWVQLGHMLKETNHLHQAEAAYNRAMSLNDCDWDLHLQLGHLYVVIGDTQKASGSYAQAIRLGSRDRHALHFLAGQPDRDRIVREAIARLLPTESMRWHALRTQADPSIFSRFIAGLVVA